MKFQDVRGEANDGKVFTITSPEVQKHLLIHPDLSLEMAISNVVTIHNFGETLAAYNKYIITEDDITNLPKLAEMGFSNGNMLLVHKNETLEDAVNRTFETGAYVAK